MIIRTGFVGRQVPAGAGRPGLDASFVGAVPAAFTFTRASTATDGQYTDASGSSYNTLGVNTPRVGSNGLLIEDQRTNFLLNSDAPVTQVPTLAARTYIMWVIGTGSVTVTPGTATITTGNGGTASAGTPLLFIVTVGGTVNITVTGSLTRYQCEGTAAGGSLTNTPTSYIPTTGAAVTRAVELCSAPTSSAWFNTVGFSMACTCMAPYARTTGLNVAAQVDDGTTNNRVALGAQAGLTSGRLIDYFTAGTLDGTAITAGALTAGVPARIAGAASAAGLNVSLNGGAVANAASPNFPGAALNRLVIGAGMAGVAPWNGYISRIRLWARLLSNAELIAASA